MHEVKGCGIHDETQFRTYQAKLLMRKARKNPSGFLKIDHISNCLREPN